MAIDSTKVTVRLIGADDADGAVFFADFRHFCDGLEACLKRAEKVATGRSGRIAYRIAGLGMGSAHITLEAVKLGSGRDARGPALRLFRKTVTAIQGGRQLDPRVGPEDVALFKKLASPLSGQSKALFIDEMEITPQYTANADKILRSGTVQEGTVTGLLEKVNVHHRCQFVLYPPIPGYAVTCDFPENMLPEVGKAIKRNVTVRGSMRYYA
ncbi:MAG: hypothetical protein ACREHD_22380, partial [Pirellulales bacterium]